MESFTQSIGGLGLFLFGMGVMTSGLKQLAGAKLHRWLGHATQTPLSGAVTGTIVTALIQSSSATTIAAVGFVGAGLLTFAQSLGIIFGANIGTTMTGWIVALIGFKLHLDILSLPILFLGALLYLAKSGSPVRGTGKAIAGFALIFLGIDFLQSGISGLRDLIDLSHLNAGEFSGRIALVFAGIALTLITQSSSATVAAALTALNTSVIDLPQAAAMIIGADIGTTGSAILATIGGNTASRRTGFAHFAYNLMTGLGAFLLLPLYLWLWARWSPNFLDQSPEIVAVSYHTVFNTLGVLAVLPFTRRFAAFIERIIPEREKPLTAALDKRLLVDTAIALESLDSVVRSLAQLSLDWTASILNRDQYRQPEISLEEVIDGLSEAREYAGQLGEFSHTEGETLPQLMAILHILDHLDRLASRAQKRARFKELQALPELRAYGKTMAQELNWLANEIIARAPVSTESRLQKAARELEDDKPRFRTELITAAAQGKIEGPDLDLALDAARWLRRIVYHSWRIAHYCSKITKSPNESAAGR